MHKSQNNKFFPHLEVNLTSRSIIIAINIFKTNNDEDTSR